MTKLNRELLQEVVVEGSGRYYDLSDVKTAGLMIQDLLSLTEKTGSEGIVFRDQMNFRFFLILALISLV